MPVCGSLEIGHTYKISRTQATEATRTTVGYIHFDKSIQHFEFVNRALRMGRPVSLNFSSCRSKSSGATILLPNRLGHSLPSVHVVPPCTMRPFATKKCPSPAFLVLARMTSTIWTRGGLGSLMQCSSRLPLTPSPDHAESYPLCRQPSRMHHMPGRLLQIDVLTFLRQAREYPFLPLLPKEASK